MALPFSLPEILHTPHKKSLFLSLGALRVNLGCSPFKCPVQHSSVTFFHTAGSRSEERARHFWPFFTTFHILCCCSPKKHLFPTSVRHSVCLHALQWTIGCAIPSQKERLLETENDKQGCLLKLTSLSSIL